MTSHLMERPEHDSAFITFSTWRGSTYSDDAVIILRNFGRSYMDPKGFKKVFLGFRLAKNGALLEAR